MNRTVRLEWNYSPKNFLEVEHLLKFNGDDIIFLNGLITINKDENSLRGNPHFAGDAEEKIRKYLYGVAIYSHKNFEFCRGSTKYLNNDGTVEEFPVLKTITAITQKEWETVGKLANTSPIKEGRHRGKHFKDLRKVTWAELQAARKAAKEILLKYLTFIQLNKQNIEINE